MFEIDRVEWGRITVNDKEFRQVLIVGDEVIERDSEALYRLFGTTHKMSDDEVKKLLENQPEVIVIGTGWEGMVEISAKFPERSASWRINGAGAVQSSKLKIELKILKTPEAVEEYNKLVLGGKRVNALIHTTC